MEPYPIISDARALSELFAATTFVAFARVFLRSLGAVWFAPGVGGALVSPLARVACAFSLALVAFPSGVSSARAGAFSLSVSPLLFGLIADFFFGSAVGLALKVFFGFARLAGETIARVGGIAVAGSFDEALGEESTSPTRFLSALAVVVFALFGGLELFVDGFLGTFVASPIGFELDFETSANAMQRGVVASFALGLKLTGPTVVAALAIYLGSGFAGRLSSLSNLSTLTFNLNAFVAILMLLLAVGALCRAAHASTTEFLRELFAAFSGGG